ncbi:hypothetical protein H8356DRAFT_1324028 [Neocallimastix lanati (nom. inval.)]|nr:hypothetical protein H8356DRAFT_1324028 [Neocallimastix sp. JGI-2020a]
MDIDYSSKHLCAASFYVYIPPHISCCYTNFSLYQPSTNTPTHHFESLEPYNVNWTFSSFTSVLNKWLSYITILKGFFQMNVNIKEMKKENKSRRRM